MAWIESHQELARHPKTRKLARRLGVNLPTAIGHLHMFWWWAMDYSKSGDITSFDAIDIADAVGWDGDEEVFIKCLIECGFIDSLNDQLMIHDWIKYGGKYHNTIEKKGPRQSDIRKAYQDGTIAKVKERDGDNCRYCSMLVDWNDRRTNKGGTYDRIDPESPAILDNLVVSCRGCSEKKKDKTIESAGMHLIPLNVTPETSSVTFNDSSNEGLNTLNDDTKDSSLHLIREEEKREENRRTENKTKDIKTPPQQENDGGSGGGGGDLDDLDIDPEFAKAFQAVEKHYPGRINPVQAQCLTEHLSSGIKAELIEEALKTTRMAGKDIKYFLGVLNNCKDRKLYTAQDYLEDQAQYDAFRSRQSRAQPPDRTRTGKPISSSINVPNGLPGLSDDEMEEALRLAAKLDSNKTKVR